MFGERVDFRKFVDFKESIKFGKDSKFREKWSLESTGREKVKLREDVEFREDKCGGWRVKGVVKFGSKVQFIRRITFFKSYLYDYIII
jgi:hypothetical protein